MDTPHTSLPIPSMYSDFTICPDTIRVWVSLWGAGHQALAEIMLESLGGCEKHHTESSASS